MLEWYRNRGTASRFCLCDAFRAEAEEPSAAKLASRDRHHLCTRKKRQSSSLFMIGTLALSLYTDTHTGPAAAAGAAATAIAAAMTPGAGLPRRPMRVMMNMSV